MHWSGTPKAFQVPHPAHLLYADKSEEIDQFEINKEEISPVSGTGGTPRAQTSTENAELKLIITATMSEGSDCQHNS